MQRFILEQNIARFERLLREEKRAEARQTLQGLMTAAQRDLALLVASSLGACPYPLVPLAEKNLRRDPSLSAFEAAFEVSEQPLLVVDPRPGLRIVDANKPYVLATLTERTNLSGRFLFDAFPDNPADRDANGVSNLFASIQRVAQSGVQHRMAIQRYDVRNTEGRFVERYWQPVNSPVFDEQQQLIYILHSVEDVTAHVLAMRTGADQAR